MYWLLDYAEQENLAPANEFTYKAQFSIGSLEINQSRFFLSLVERAALLQEH